MSGCHKHAHDLAAALQETVRGQAELIVKLKEEIATLRAGYAVTLGPPPCEHVYEVGGMATGLKACHKCGQYTFLSDSALLPAVTISSF